jgi:hypothetical protein
MNMLKPTTLALSLLALLQIPVALAEEAPKLEPAPATAAAPAPLEDMQTMRERMLDMIQAQGMGPGGKCNQRDGQGPGMMMQGCPMGQGRHCDRMEGMGPGMGGNCHRMGDGGCGCEKGREMSKRLDELEKRMDMVQMMLKMMMK